MNPGTVTALAQGDADVRFAWGPAGAASTPADVIVIVDVLSFSTAVTVATSRGMQVYPYTWPDQSAAQFAHSHDAVLALDRLDAARSADASVTTLSPHDLMTCKPIPRLVLPSPNGSSIAAGLDRSEAVIAAGCLRNARAVSQWLAPQIERARTVTIVAAGEQWSQDGSLRPCVEDLLGAGAIIGELADLDPVAKLSAEAQVAADAFAASRTAMAERLRTGVSGAELIAQGFDADVVLASAINFTPVVPILVDGYFVHDGPPIAESVVALV